MEVLQSLKVEWYRYSKIPSSHLKHNFNISDPANHHRHSPDVRHLLILSRLFFHKIWKNIASGLQMHISLECPDSPTVFASEHHPNRECLSDCQVAGFVLRLSTFLAMFFHSLPTLSYEIKVPKTIVNRGHWL